MRFIIIGVFYNVRPSNETHPPTKIGSTRRTRSYPLPALDRVVGCRSSYCVPARHKQLPNLGAGLGRLEQGTPAYLCGGEIVAALKAYRAALPGTVKDFLLELADLRHDPRILAEASYLSVLPVDPVAQNQDWGVIRNVKKQVVGVHSRSNESPTLFAKLFSRRSGEKYSDWKFVTE